MRLKFVNPDQDLLHHIGGGVNFKLKDMDSNKEKYTSHASAKNKDLHHPWAQGFEIKKDQRVYHPYTRKDFKFGEDLSFG